MRAPPAAPADADGALQALLGSYAFLHSVYVHHSTAEDEVVFPALERKASRERAWKEG